MNNPVYSQHVDPLSVACVLLIALSPLLLENNYLLGLRMLLNGCKNTGISNAWPSDRSVLGSTHHQYVVEADLLPNLKWNLLDHYPVIDGDLVLLSQKAHHCEHLFWMGWKGHPDLLIVNVHDCILSFDWSPFFVSQLLCFSFESFLLEGKFPGIGSFGVFSVLQKLVKDLYSVLLVEVSEKLAEALCLEMTNYRRSRLSRQQ